MNPKEKEVNLVYQLFDHYNAFVGARGVRRIKAVEWSAQKLRLIKPELSQSIGDETLLQRVGWSTFIGLGLYSGLIHTFRTSHFADDPKCQQIINSLLNIINDIIKYTDIGYYLSLGSSLSKSESLKYTRIDGSGNIFIYPADSEELLIDIEVNLL